MHHLLSLLVSLAIFTTLNANPTPSKTYQNHAILDRDGEYHLFWEHNQYKIKITFEVHAKTTGYVGLGFSPKGSMAHADIVIGWVNGSEAGIKDCHGQNKNDRPNCNESQDVKLLKASSINNWTMITFERKIKLCNEHDLRITEGTMRVIWAMGKYDEIVYHGPRRGTKFMYLLGVKPMNDPLPKDVKTIDITMKNFTPPVKGDGTFYACSLHLLPNLTDKHHVIRFDPIIMKGNEMNVHHMLVYTCVADLNNDTNVSSQLNTTGRCYGAGTQVGFGKCVDPVFVWTIGGSNFTFPAHVGVPIGTDKESKYIRLEIHYDNPQLKTNIVDSSGIRLYYTATLRQHDLGILNMGKNSIFTFMIPPKTKFKSIVYTPSICTDQAAFGHSQIKAIGILPHTHLIGTGVKHRHFRNGVELPPLINDQTYDFDWQMVKMYEKEVAIQPGDYFMVECNYDSSTRSETTLGGLSTYDEMCMTFVWVYPRTPVHMIYTGIDFETHYQFANKNKLPGTTIQFSNITELRRTLKKNITWTKKAISEWQDIEYKGENNAYCTFTNGSHLKAKFETRIKPFKPPSRPFQPSDECWPNAGTSITVPGVTVMTSSVIAFIYLFAFIFCNQ